MSVHDDKGHDEEASIHQDNHQHRCNERPHKVSVRIQPTSAKEQRELEHWLTAFSPYLHNAWYFSGLIGCLNITIAVTQLMGCGQAEGNTEDHIQEGSTCVHST